MQNRCFSRPRMHSSLVTAAYAMLNDMGGAGIQADTWYSAIRSGDNYKGGAGKLPTLGVTILTEMVAPIMASDGTANRRMEYRLRLYFEMQQSVSCAEQAHR
ncbi:MAG: hypothetical protein MZV63_57620 [Marinilabiliales bacterium]|nr:hypothetical protein [Marinilabiliales bacterium]